MSLPGAPGRSIFSYFTGQPQSNRNFDQLMEVPALRFDDLSPDERETLKNRLQTLRPGDVDDAMLLKLKSLRLTDDVISEREQTQRDQLDRWSIWGLRRVLVTASKGLAVVFVGGAAASFASVSVAPLAIVGVGAALGYTLYLRSNSIEVEARAKMLSDYTIFETSIQRHLKTVIATKEEVLASEIQREINQLQAMNLSANDYDPNKSVRNIQILRAAMGQINHLRAQIAAVRTARKSAVVHLKESDDQCLRLRNEISNLQQQLRKLERERLVPMEHDALLMGREISTLKNQLDSVSEEKRQLETDQLEPLRLSAEAMRGDIATLTEQLAVARNGNGALARNVDQLNNEMSELEAALEAETRARNKATRELEEEKFEHLQLKNLRTRDLAEKDQRARRAVQKIEGLEAQLLEEQGKLQQQLSKEQVYEAEKAQTETRIQELEDHLKTVREEKRQAAWGLELLEKERREAAESLDKRERDIEEIRQQLQVQSAELLEERNKLKIEQETIEFRITDLKQAHDEEIGLYEESLQKLVDEDLAFKYRTKDNQHLVQRIKDLEFKLQDTQMQLNEKAKEVGLDNTTKFNLVTALKNAKEEVAEVQLQKMKLQREFRSREIDIDKFSKNAVKKIEELKQIIDEQKQTIEEQKEQVVELNNTVLGLEMNVAKHKAKEDEVDGGIDPFELEEKEMEVEALTEELEKANEALASSQMKLAELEGLREELELEKLARQTDRQKAMAQNQEVRDVAVQAQKEIQGYRESLSEFKKILETQQQEFAGMLNKLRTDIEQKTAAAQQEWDKEFTAGMTVKMSFAEEGLKAENHHLSEIRRLQAEMKNLELQNQGLVQSAIKLEAELTVAKKGVPGKKEAFRQQMSLMEFQLQSSQRKFEDLNALYEAQSKTISELTKEVTTQSDSLASLKREREQLTVQLKIQEENAETRAEDLFRQMEALRSDKARLVERLEGIGEGVHEYVEQGPKSGGGDLEALQDDLRRAQAEIGNLKDKLEDSEDLRLAYNDQALELEELNGQLEKVTLLLEAEVAKREQFENYEAITDDEHALTKGTAVDETVTTVDVVEEGDSDGDDSLTKEEIYSEVSEMKSMLERFKQEVAEAQVDDLWVKAERAQAEANYLRQLESESQRRTLEAQQLLLEALTELQKHYLDESTEKAQLVERCVKATQANADFADYCDEIRERLASFEVQSLEAS